MQMRHFLHDVIQIWTHSNVSYHPRSVAVLNIGNHGRVNHKNLIREEIHNYCDLKGHVLSVLLFVFTLAINVGPLVQVLISFGL